MYPTELCIAQQMCLFYSDPERKNQPEAAER